MLYELRHYAIPPGRMTDIALRMLADVPPLFLHHGMRAVAHWSIIAGADLPSFLYVLEWRDAAEREAGWQSFYDDPRWWEIRARTNGRSELVESYGLWLMKPNPTWSPPFPPLQRAAPGEIHEIALHHVAIGQNAAIADHIEQHIMPSVARAGGRVLAVLDMIAGPRVPAVAIVVAWPDFTSGLRLWSEARDRPERGFVQEAELLGRRDTYVLQPMLTTDFSLTRQRDVSS